MVSSINFLALAKGGITVKQFSFFKALYHITRMCVVVFYSMRYTNHKTVNKVINLFDLYSYNS